MGRLIPACAGKTLISEAVPGAAQAHPRVCGENCPPSHETTDAPGSSPRVRGKRRLRGPPWPGGGLIPACAGKTVTPPPPSPPRSAHPRVCGENARRGLAHRRASWLIPACAGKTADEVRQAGRDRAHPRVCGENALRAVSGRDESGSSPRVRGKPITGAMNWLSDGLIPACAGKTGLVVRDPRAGQAHPRVCGENLADELTELKPGGSSPRVRGKLKRARGFARCVWLIPACAGKTSSASPRPGVPAAHPRVCGENVGSLHGPLIRRGSSPRVRGKPVHGGHPHTVTRLIPACAGKTFPDPAKTSIPAAHPRVCGENPFPSRRAPHVAGSSPRVRGKPLPVAQGPPRGGLIPACAGKTRGAGLQVQDGPAHPRVCGENAGGDHVEALPAGSSPRVRGKHDDLAAGLDPSGLIPACAGKTEPTTTRFSSGSAHPRVCGENQAALHGAQAVGGSSPRVRGKPSSRARSAHDSGLIPACAGKTPARCGQAALPPAHPRVCGENANGTQWQGIADGSSPRVRGKRGDGPAVLVEAGLIPACAGKTWRRMAGICNLAAHPRVCGENLRPRS